MFILSPCTAETDLDCHRKPFLTDNPLVQTVTVGWRRYYYRLLEQVVDE